MELRLLALYPEQMNIYADRGNILFLAAPLRVARDRLRAYAAPGPGERFDPAAHDLIYIGGGQDRDQRLVAEDMLRTQARGARAPRSTTARWCSPSAAATSCSATATSSARSGSRGSALVDLETVREPGAAADRQRRDRGRPRRRPAA